MIDPQSSMSSAAWRKSSRSNSSGDACVELAGLPSAVAVRDSKHPHSGVLEFTQQEWRVFTDSLKRS